VSPAPAPTLRRPTPVAGDHAVQHETARDVGSQLIDGAPFLFAERESTDREDAEILPGQEIYRSSRAVGLDQLGVFPRRWITCLDTCIVPINASRGAESSMPSGPF
jgi:hypothetical protein